ncbi:TonB family protein [Psychromonas aquatilis]|uniref:TonB family protein n=1 Tax=Psychromonas aquatilis TaxID=2005072 RepID=A0ABU9GNJ1_9GAMM
MNQSDVGPSSFRSIVTWVFVLHIILIAALFWKIKIENVALQHAPKAKVSIGFRSAAAGKIASNEVAPQEAVKPIQQKAKPIKTPVSEPQTLKNNKLKETNKKLGLEKIKKKKPKPIVEAPSTKKKQGKKQKEKIKKITEERETSQVNKVVPTVQQKKQIQGAGGIDGSVDNKLKVHESGQAETLSGDPDSAIYDALLRKHLMKFKRYPRTLKIKRKEGTVEVVFNINKQGKVLNHKVVKRTGDRAFDRAIRRLFDEAQPIPLPPENTTWATREYRLVFSYKLD